MESVSTKRNPDVDEPVTNLIRIRCPDSRPFLAFEVEEFGELYLRHRSLTEECHLLTRNRLCLRFALICFVEVVVLDSEEALLY
ncbi:MAG TPA: hypothetical protein ENH82_13835 [bacterium]|nr:hypothetical protein [bacterium]